MEVFGITYETQWFDLSNNSDINSQLPHFYATKNGSSLLLDV
jgi:hypothetical protein